MLKKTFRENPAQMMTAAAFLLVIFFLFLALVIRSGPISAAFLAEYRAEVPTGAPILERVDGAIDVLENQIDLNFAARDQFNELFGLAHLVMDRNSIRDPNYGNLYRTNYGQITYLVKEKPILPYVRSTVELAGKIEAAGIPFLYVQAPFKLPGDEQQVPASYTDYSNSNADRYMKLLNACGVKSYDMRGDFWKLGESQNALFFNTDHHWTIDGAFYATGLLSQHLNDHYDFNIDKNYYNPDNFTRTTYEDFYIGSMGRRVGRIYGGMDDFTLITPNFPTDYTLRQWDYGAETIFKGSFEDAILVNDYMDESAPLSTNRYAVYHGDNTELIFENHLVDSDKKILLIKDSFGVPVYSFLSLGVKELRAIDVRLFTEDVAEYAIGFEPDLVVMLYNADSLSEDMFKFKEKVIQYD